MTGLFLKICTGDPMNFLRVFATIALLLCGTSLLAGGVLTAQPRNSAVGTGHTVYELRQYTLHPDQRDVLINVFDSEFVEGQDATGMWVIGQFRDLNNPDRFVWLRSFPDMASRATQLDAFYSGPIWQGHRDIANPTMVDSDNVLLLRSARVGTGFPRVTVALAPRDRKGPGRGLVVGHIIYLRAHPSVDAKGSFMDFFDSEVKPRLDRAGETIVAELETEPSANNFPKLPIREGEHVFAWFSTFADRAAYDRQRRSLALDPVWRVVAGRFSLWTSQPMETLALEPTARSRLHG
jgi:hypothetical protein